MNTSITWGVGDPRFLDMRRSCVAAVRGRCDARIEFGFRSVELEMAELICDWMPSIEKVGW